MYRIVTNIKVSTEQKTKLLKSRSDEKNIREEEDGQNPAGTNLNSRSTPTDEKMSRRDGGIE